MKRNKSFLSSKIIYLSEQTGDTENIFKDRLKILFEKWNLIEKAYLVTITYANNNSIFVALCLRLSKYDNKNKILQEIKNIFTNMFNSDQQLDIIFLNDSEEETIKRKCNPFFINKNK